MHFLVMFWMGWVIDILLHLCHDFCDLLIFELIIKLQWQKAQEEAAFGWSKWRFRSQSSGGGWRSRNSGEIYIIPVQVCSSGSGKWNLFGILVLLSLEFFLKCVPRKESGFFDLGTGYAVKAGKVRYQHAEAPQESARGEFIVYRNAFMLLLFYICFYLYGSFHTALLFYSFFECFVALITAKLGCIYLIWRCTWKNNFKRQIVYPLKFRSLKISCTKKRKSAKGRKQQVCSFLAFHDALRLWGIYSNVIVSPFCLVFFWHERMFRITSKIKKFVKAHQRYSRSQDELKRQKLFSFIFMLIFDLRMHV